MNLVKPKKKKMLVLLKVLMLILCIYFIFLLVSRQVQINKKKLELNKLEEQISTQDIKNEQIQEIIDSDDEHMKKYIEKIARESLDFAKHGEKVYINILGN